jgi:hypothetical protein
MVYNTIAGYYCAPYPFIDSSAKSLSTDNIDTSSRRKKAA